MKTFKKFIALTLIILLSLFLFSRKIRKKYNRSKIKKIAFLDSSKNYTKIFRPLSSSGEKLIDYINIDDNGLFSFEKIKCSFPETGIFTFENAELINSDGLIRTNRGSYVRESIEVSLMHNSSVLDCIGGHRYTSKVVLEGTCAVLCAPCSNCYYHWMIDVLPRLELLKNSNIDVDYYIFSELSQKFQKETLEILGIKKEKIIEISRTPYLIKKLVYPYKPTIVDIDHNTQCYSLNLDSINFLIDNFKFKNVQKPFRKIFISRRLSSRRKIINQNEIDEFFEQAGYEILYLEEMTFKDQIKSFQEASIVVSTHGAGLTNLIFCEPETRVLEIFPANVFAYRFPKGHEIHLYARISKLNNLKYNFIIGETSVEKYATAWDANICDFYLSTKKFKDLKLN